MLKFISFFRESIDSLTIQFATPDKRSVWEAAFNDAKQKLGNLYILLKNSVLNVIFIKRKRNC